MEETDEIVYRRFLKTRGEEDLRLLFDRHREGLFLFLLSIVSSEEDAEDLMMDVFSVVASGTAAFSGRSSFRTWLFAVGRKRAATFIHRQARNRRLQTQVSGSSEEEERPEPALLQKEEKRKLYRALEALPDEYRQVLYLLYFEQMSREEVCRTMRKTRKQVYNLAERGRRSLREALERMTSDDGLPD